jgi:hypothetical protein
VAGTKATLIGPKEASLQDPAWSHHVFTVVSGYGLRVIPRAPFRVVRGPRPQELDVHHDGPEGPKFARLIADGVGGYLSKIDQHTASLDDVLDAEKGPIPDDWQLDTGQFRVAFPAGFALHSVPADSISPFDLVGAGPSLIYVQSPVHVSSPAALCGPGQTVSKSGNDWIEVTYLHDGKRWWQRHQIVGRRVFSAQSPSEAQDGTRTALGTVVASLVLVEG